MSTAAFTFDLDGTLADTDRLRIFLLPAALRRPAIYSKLQAGFEELRGQRRADLDEELCRRVATRCGCPLAEVRTALLEVIDGRWADSFRHARVPEGVLGLIARVDQLGFARAVVSDHPALRKLAAMRHPSLRPERWAAIVDCRRLGAMKPLPDGLYAAAAALGQPTGALVHVGDRPETDGAMARAAGARFFDVRDAAAMNALLRELG